MNFKKMPKEKRNMLVAVVVGTLLAVAGLYSFLIKHQRENLAHLAQRQVEIRDRQRQILEATQRASQIEADLSKAQARLAEVEVDIASGDLYSWLINTLRQFKAAYKVDIPQFSSLGAVTDVSLLRGLPYKQTSLSLAGTAHFHDFGLFLADLENQFPHIRVVNLNLDLNPSAASGDQETVSFRLDILTLVKTNPS